MTDRADAELTFALCAGLVLSDDDEDDAERGWLDDLAARLGLSPAPTAKALAPAEAAELALRVTPDAREEVLAALLDAAAADETVLFQERAYLHAVGAMLGVDEREVDRRITARISRR